MSRERRTWLPRVAGLILHPNEEGMRVLALPFHEREAAWKVFLNGQIPNLTESQLSRAALYMEEHHHDMVVHVMKEMTELKRDLDLYKSQAQAVVTRLLDTELAAALSVLENNVSSL